MVVSHIETRTGDYLVVDFGDCGLTIFRKKGGKYQSPRDIEFKTPEDYRRFRTDLDEAQQHSDALQGDVVVERLLGKLKVEWTGEE